MKQELTELKEHEFITDLSHKLTSKKLVRIEKI